MYNFVKNRFIFFFDEFCELKIKSIEKYIKIADDEYWVDSTLCNNCHGYYSQPQCVIACPTNAPIPLHAKKGRCKVEGELPPSKLSGGGIKRNGTDSVAPSNEVF